MFALGILIGIFSYIIFALGMMGLLTSEIVKFTTVLYWICAGGVWIFLYRRGIIRNDSVRSMFCGFRKDKRHWMLGVLLLALSIVYAFGALIPERAFDALWYHLTLPKLYLAEHSISFIPGGLLYYSTMPKLTEMLYTASLAFGDDVLTRFIHYGFGVLVTASIFTYVRKYYSLFFALLASVIFYSNIVVGWESTTAYIDLARAFFEFLALWCFTNYIETRQKSWFVESAVMVGLAISTKLIALGSLVIFVALIFIVFQKNVLQKRIAKSALFVGTALVVPLPWFMFSFLSTGNPFYPIFSGYQLDSINIIRIFPDLLNVFLRADDPISPLYIIVLPLLYFTYRSMNKREKIFTWYCLLSLLIWSVTPKTGGGRFILAYLPALSVLSVMIIRLVKSAYITKLLFVTVLGIGCITVIYRFVAQSHAIPVVMGRESRHEYLSQNLNYEFGDFYDSDSYFKTRIQQDDRVLIYGIHNLYYIDFPFVHESYVKPADTFTYVLVGGNSDLPPRFQHWTLVYENAITQVKLYYSGGQVWEY